MSADRPYLQLLLDKAGSLLAGEAGVRNRRVLQTAAASLAARVVSFATQLVVIPIALHYLGVERFGLYMTLGSLLVIFPAADLGLGNGLMNILADAYGRENRSEMRSALSSTLVVLSVLVFGLLVSLAALYERIPWGSLLNVTSPLARSETRGAVAVLLALAILNIPGSIIQRAQLALQEGYLASLWQAMGSIAGMLFLVLSTHLQLGLPWIVGALAGGPLVATLLNYLHFLGWRHTDLRPCLSLSTWIMASRLLRTSGLFLCLQLFWIAAYQLDRFVIIRSLGPASVSAFAIGATLFIAISSVVSLFVMPLWPAYGEARARQDRPWIRTALLVSMSGSGAACLVAGLGVIAAKPLIERYWLHEEVTLGLPLLLLFTAWTAVESTGAAFGTMLNGTGHLKEQIALAAVFSAACITAKVLLVTRLGPAGILVGAISCYLVITLPTCIVIARKLVRAGEL
jgi:O-antigen/teichoic acid export membrane protein